MHFVVPYIVVVVIVVVVWYAPCEQQKTNTKQCNVLQILLIDRVAGTGKGEGGKVGVHFAYHVAISESVTCAWRACIALHLSRSISTPHSSGGASVLASGTVQGKALARALP